jgi:stage V sporulation protein G
VEITEVRIKLMEEAGERLQAFCSITFDDCFVIRDLKIIEGTSGPFVAMPSRKLTSHCFQCGCKNHLRAGYCNQCGSRLKDDRAIKDEDGRAKLYADIAHPINSACREAIQERVIKSFYEEVDRSRLPGYVSSYDDFDEEPGPAPARDSHGSRRPAVHKEASPVPQSTAAGNNQNKLEPAAQEPRRPHSVPARQPATRDSHEKAGGFGAGIL